MWSWLGSSSAMGSGSFLSICVSGVHFRWSQHMGVFLFWFPWVFVVRSGRNPRLWVFEYLLFHRRRVMAAIPNVFSRRQVVFLRHHLQWSCWVSNQRA
ncbi:hypothetical protein Acr_01g0009950 [Actinidia rufa]|uniref:Uncharacterized protein n=1 Tax=Actinidia rufa TaxID=165716 RepID=A0A7J0E4T3_9ERIC|nr:hypothetical protein Acr_01g0009950 [Actinidia rufa]